MSSHMVGVEASTYGRADPRWPTEVPDERRTLNVEARRFAREPARPTPHRSARRHLVDLRSYAAAHVQPWLPENERSSCSRLDAG